MRILILTMFLAVVQTAPPVPRQATNSPTSASREVQKNPSDNQTSPAPSQPLVNPSPVPKHDDSGQGKATNDAEHTVVIREPVSVAVYRDWLDWGIWIFNGLLVAVGYLQWRVLSRQAEIMNTHAEHLSKLATALDTSNNQNATFFKMQNRPWVGMSKELILLEKKSTKPGQYGFTLGYAVRNFGSATAFNTVVVLGDAVDNPNDHGLVKAKVAEARKQGENIMGLTGDLLLPTVEKYDTYLFSERIRPKTFAIPGCIVYRFSDGTVHYTELSYWVDFAEGEKATFRTLWFQDAD